MTKAAEQVLEQAMRLDPADRAELIDRLDELDDSGSKGRDLGYDEAWATELRERAAEFERDPTVGVPWQDVVARLRGTAGRGESTADRPPAGGSGGGGGHRLLRRY